MESILSLFIEYDTIVVGGLVLAIAMTIVLLMIFNQKSPRGVISTELDGTEPIEGALRRVLRERNQRDLEEIDDEPQPEMKTPSDESIELLKKEILDKDRTIVELNKELNQRVTQPGEVAAATTNTNSEELEKRIAELEAKLEEYELIEDDIADLSNFRDENEKLKAELASLKGGGTAASVENEQPSETEVSHENTDQGDVELAADQSDKGSDPEVSEDLQENQETEATEEASESPTIQAEGVDEVQPEAVQTAEKEASPAQDSDQESSLEADEVSQSEDNKVSPPTSGESKDTEESATEEPEEDLVSEFEKVVSQQEAMDAGEEVKEAEKDVAAPDKLETDHSDLESHAEEMPKDKSPGEEKATEPATSVEDVDLPPELEVHPKLQDITKDSKEEADVFIDELKSLKKGS